MSAGLAIIAAHMVGDYVTQTNDMSIAKRTDWRVRLWHVWWYALPFPFIYLIAVGAAGTRIGTSGLVWNALAFWVAVAVPHFVVDSSRWDRPAVPLLGIARWTCRMPPNACPPSCPVCRDTLDRIQKMDAAPRPWPPKPIMVDQAIHAVCLAVAAAAFGL